MAALPDNAEQPSLKETRFVPPAPELYRGSRYKPPVVATLLSLMPGLGQAYLGYTQLGFVHGVSAAALIALMSSNTLHRLEPFFGVFMVFGFLYNLVDAYRRAVLINEAAAHLETLSLPSGSGTLTFGTRIALGLALIVVGTGWFLHARFGISFEWLAAWWPLGAVGFGVYLVVRALKDRFEQTRSV